MARYPWLLVLTAVGTAVLMLTGAVSPQPPASPPAAPSALPPVRHDGAEAADLLDRAADAYSPPRASWLQMGLWQRHHGEEGALEIHGRYVAAPDYRLRLELKVRVGRTQGDLTVVCDGKAVWQYLRLNGRKRGLIQVELPTPKEGESPATVEAARTELLRKEAFLGVGPLLRVLRQGMVGMRREPARWKGADAVRVTGAWRADPGKLAGIPEPLRPRNVPRECSVLLDGRTLWPHRIEWRGDPRTEKETGLLLEVEFRDPVFGRPLSPERCAQEFAFTPG